MTDLCARVHQFADGELGADTAGSFRWHLASCNGCQLELEMILALRALARQGLSALARSLTDEPAAAGSRADRSAPNVIDPRTSAASRATMEVEVVEPRRRRLPWIGGVPVGYAAVPMLAVAGFVALWIGRSAGPAIAEDPVIGAAFAALAGSARPIDERFSYPAADRYQPPAPVMRGGPSVHPLPTKALARLEERVDQHGMVVLLMSAGEWDRAEALIQRLPGSPELDNERAVLDLHRGRLDLAERRLQSVLRARPRLSAPLWNLGLLYQRRGEIDRARQTFTEMAARGEPGWALEAERRARDLAALP
jgi:hypothetical protein